jgi:ubiquinone/menaquinone biosynthesis C-methylase UbiE
MNFTERYIQKFSDPNAPYEHHDWQPETQALLLRFAHSLPPSPKGIIDLASGRGRDALFLIQSGFPVIAQDVNQSMIRTSLVPHNCRWGDATHLPDSDMSFGGAMLIDSLLYFSPPQRRHMLHEAYRTLVPGGRLLVISEQQDHSYMHVYDKKEKWIVYEPQLSSESQDEFIQRINTLLATKRVTIQTAQFRCDPDEFSYYAVCAGFTEVERQIYPEHTSISEESRWQKGRYPYFSQIFQKMG